MAANLLTALASSQISRSPVTSDRRGRSRATAPRAHSSTRRRNAAAVGAPSDESCYSHLAAVASGTNQAARLFRRLSRALRPCPVVGSPTRCCTRSRSRTSGSTSPPARRLSWRPRSLRPRTTGSRPTARPDSSGTRCFDQLQVSPYESPDVEGRRRLVRRGGDGHRQRNQAIDAAARVFFIQLPVSAGIGDDDRVRGAHR
jgi:hypothetical protein